MNADKGEAAERLAETYLQQHGLQLVERNYRCRYGEIDLVMRDGRETVFVEVRLRSRQDFGGAAASITLQKQRKLLRAAEHYLIQSKDGACRFDTVLLGSLSTTDLQWIKNAFDAPWT